MTDLRKKIPLTWEVGKEYPKDPDFEIKVTSGRNNFVKLSHKVEGIFCRRERARIVHKKEFGVICPDQIGHICWVAVDANEPDSASETRRGFKYGIPTDWRPKLNGFRSMAGVKIESLTESERRVRKLTPSRGLINITF